MAIGYKSYALIKWCFGVIETLVGVMRTSSIWDSLCLESRFSLHLRPIDAQKLGVCHLSTRHWLHLQDWKKLCDNVSARLYLSQWSLLSDRGDHGWLIHCKRRDYETTAYWTVICQLRGDHKGGCCCRPQGPVKDSWCCTNRCFLMRLKAEQTFSCSVWFSFLRPNKKSSCLQTAWDV